MQYRKHRDKLEVKRVIRFYKYSPADEPRAAENVLEQAELKAADLLK
jgi:hypothetical protein